MLFVVGSGTFVGLAALFWFSLRRVDCIEPKRLFDRHGEGRSGERAEDGLFIMRPAFWAVLVFGVSVHAGRSQRCASRHRIRGMVRAM